MGAFFHVCLQIGFGRHAARLSRRRRGAGGIGGFPLADAAPERPGIRILFMPGYFGEGEDDHPGNGAPFLRKPFRPAELARKVREILDDRAEEG